MSQAKNQTGTTTSQATTQTAAGDKVITFWQATTLLPSTLLGVGTLTLPRTIAQTTGASGFLVVLGSGLLTLAIAWMVTKLGQLFPNLTFVSYTQKLFTFGERRRLGYWLALPFMVSVAIWWVMAVVIVLRLFAELQHSVVLTNTPIWFEISTMLLLSAFVASNRAEVIGRINEFLFPIILIPLLVISVLAFGDAEWSNLLPLFDISWREFWQGMIQGFSAFQGVSVLLILMAAYQQPKKAFRSHSIGIGFVVLIYFLVTMASMAVFSYEEVSELTWPVLELVKNIRIPGLIFERIESGFLILWVVAVFTTVANFLTATVHLISEYLEVEEHQRRWISFPLVVLIFILAMRPGDIYAMFTWGEKVQWYGLISTFIIAPVLLVMALVRRIGHGRKLETERKKDRH